MPSHTCTPTRLRPIAVPPLAVLFILATVRTSFIALSAVTRAVPKEKNSSVSGFSLRLADAEIAFTAARGCSIAAAAVATPDMGEGLSRSRIAVIMSEI